MTLKYLRLYLKSVVIFMITGVICALGTGIFLGHSISSFIDTIVVPQISGTAPPINLALQSVTSVQIKFSIKDNQSQVLVVGHGLFSFSPNQLADFYITYHMSSNNKDYFILRVNNKWYSKINALSPWLLTTNSGGVENSSNSRAMFYSFNDVLQQSNIELDRRMTDWTYATSEPINTFEIKSYLKTIHSPCILENFLAMFGDSTRDEVEVSLMAQNHLPVRITSICKMSNEHVLYIAQ